MTLLWADEPTVPHRDDVNAAEGMQLIQRPRQTYGLLLAAEVGTGGRPAGRGGALKE
jgi:hypothetical protein